MRFLVLKYLGLQPLTIPRQGKEYLFEHVDMMEFVSSDQNNCSLVDFTGKGKLSLSQCLQFFFLAYPCRSVSAIAY